MNQYYQQTGTEEIQVQDGSLADKALANRFDLNLWLQEQLQMVPWWGISLAFHIFAILILASISTIPDIKEKELVTIVEKKGRYR